MVRLVCTQKLGATSVEATPKIVHEKVSWLEVKSSGKLKNSRSSSRSRYAKQGTVDVVAWQTKVYVVEDVEEVGANRKAHALIYREPLDN